MDFDEYVAAHGQALLRFAYLLCRDTHTAEDLVQSALADAFRHWRRVSRADHPDAYLRRIVVNTYLGWQRRRSWFERPTPLNDVQHRTEPDHATEIVGQDAMQRALDTLPPRQRAVLILRYYEDWDDAAIARCLDIAEPTVRSNVSRALTTLRAAAALPGSPAEQLEQP